MLTSRLRRCLFPNVACLRLFSPICYVIFKQVVSHRVRIQKNALQTKSFAAYLKMEFSNETSQFQIFFHNNVIILRSVVEA